jgi:hypothetical protein
MSKAEYVQKRFRIPKSLHDELEADAIAYGTNVQRELVSRLIRGSRKASSAGMSAGITVGELEVAQKLNESLSAVLGNMKRSVEVSETIARQDSMEHELDDETEE